MKRLIVFTFGLAVPIILSAATPRTITYQGRLPVQVSGLVAAGDFIVAGTDGSGIAVPAANLTEADPDNDGDTLTDLNELGGIVKNDFDNCGMRFV